MEEFILPNNWCVEITKNNIELIKEYRERIGYVVNDGLLIFYYLYYNGCVSYDINSNNLISNEQFKKYILNISEEVNVNYDYLVPLFKNIK